MTSRAAWRVRWLAALLALSCTAGCDAAQVDLGSDLHPKAAGGSGHDTARDGGGSDASGSGGSSSVASGSGGTKSPPSTPNKDGGPSADVDAAVDHPDLDSGMAGDAGSSCAPGFADCDGEAANGCETDLETDDANCGRCERACPAFGFMSFGSTCTAGVCVLTCEAPHENCDGDPDNGCEADLRFGTSADNNCGACGVKCACNNGVCQ